MASCIVFLIVHARYRGFACNFTVVGNISLPCVFILLSQMALALTDRAIGAIIGAAVADAAGLRLFVTHACCPLGVENCLHPQN